MSRIPRVLLAVLVLSLVALTVRLALWQWGRHVERKTANAVLIERGALPPLDLVGSIPVDELEGRRIAAVGRFMDTGSVLLRSRVHRQAPGLHVVTPFAVSGSDQVILVLRGFVHSADGITPPTGIPLPDSGEMTISGVAVSFPETDDDGRPVASAAGDTTWHRLDRTVALDRARGVLPVYLVLEGGLDGPGRLEAAEPPALDDGPHLSYVIQWLLIGVAIAAFGIMVLRPRGDRGPAPPLAAL